MHPEIFSPEQFKLLPLISQFHEDFGLVGGTAIALHLGHRRSIDFDLFTDKTFDAQKVRSKISRNWKVDDTLIQGHEELTIVVNTVKLTFYLFPYPIHFVNDFQGTIRLPDLLTLGAMKAFALGKRSKWKDYVDLHYLFQRFDLHDITRKAEELFKNEFNQKLFRVQLGYFQDINYDEEILFMKGFEISSEEIKNTLEKISLS